ncbi:MAG: alpha/beta fold hydrolase [Paracoccaceae bacterium]
MTPLVLLPGMMCDARLFAPQIKALSDRLIFVPELTGHDTIRELARTVLETAPPRFALAGLSMGGVVAMEILAQAPDRIKKLALLDTTFLADAPANHAIRTRQIADVRAGRLADVMRDEMKPNYLIDSPDKPAILDLCMQMALDLGPEVFANQSKALRDRPDRQDVLKTVTQPTLIICGREDRLCPPDHHHLMYSLIPHSQLVIIDRAAHLPTLENPTDTTAALTRWLKDPA